MNYRRDAVEMDRDSQSSSVSSILMRRIDAFHLRNLLLSMNRFYCNEWIRNAARDIAGGTTTTTKKTVIRFNSLKLRKLKSSQFKTPRAGAYIECCCSRRKTSENKIKLLPQQQATHTLPRLAQLLSRKNTRTPCPSLSRSLSLPRSFQEPLQDDTIGLSFV